MDLDSLYYISGDRIDKHILDARAKRIQLYLKGVLVSCGNSERSQLRFQL